MSARKSAPRLKTTTGRERHRGAVAVIGARVHASDVPVSVRLGRWVIPVTDSRGKVATP